MISVIVPTLDEEDKIESCLERLAWPQHAGRFEVIVVDGGSRDRTRELAAAHARVLESERGRGVQMNAGARAARGEVLLFLHADTRLAGGSLTAVAQVLEDDRVVGGGFTKLYRDGGWLLGLVARGLNSIRSRWLRHFVGTQAIFVRKRVFDTLGGYRPLRFLEDVDFSDRLRRAGRVALVDLPVEVSARRYQRRGLLRQLAWNAVILALYRLGMDPERLRGLYLGPLR